MSIPTTCEFRHVNSGNLRAFVSIHYGDFIIRDFKVLEKKDGGLWVAPPSKKVDGAEKTRYIDVAFLPDTGRREAFQRFVLERYSKDVRESNKESKATG